ncbi:MULTISPECIES: hypothetical protein [Leptospira]|uniref:Uncharacterized protein n=1 Tax=Leptospira kirschneri serovar Pomona TaxID=561005 RepID=A0A1T1DHK6_9LEPT|nr:hypothetical protein [Leptospira sp. ZV016]KXZ25045.1 hypothetical protein AYB32_17825 [Leptospira kirschneri]KXZ26910.1 hypothetical protein AYB34_18130 [Leptospira sp. ZV016]OOV40338.1 hypothetical protein B1J93_17545 [Leptospira kirschneri serovar Pomona]
MSLDVSKKLAGEAIYRFQSHFFLFFYPTRSVFTLAQKPISEVLFLKKSKVNFGIQSLRFSFT